MAIIQSGWPSYRQTPATAVAVRWEELLPEEFDRRLGRMPVVYLPLGLCEPHGHIAPFGLDTLKAEYLCVQAALRYGGIVAPTLAYQIHESGYHAPWLDEVIGAANPRLAGLPPHVVLEVFLYQLRAFRNAGFAALVAISGHAGGNQIDLRMVAAEFAAHFPFEHFVCADPELVAGTFEGDHAGRYEISQLLAIHPDLIHMDRIGRSQRPEFGRLGQNPDANLASAGLGRQILDAQLDAVGEIVGGFKLSGAPQRPIALDEMRPLWAKILEREATWKTNTL